MSQPEFLNSLYSLFTLALLGMSAVVWVQLLSGSGPGVMVMTPRFRRAQVSLPPLIVGVTLFYFIVFMVLPLLVVWLKPAKFTSDFFTMSRAEVWAMLTLNLLEGVIAIPILLAAVLTGTRHRVDRIRLGFRTDRIEEQLREGFIGFLLAALPVALTILVTSPLRGKELEHPFLQLLRSWGPGPEMALIFLQAGVIAPLKEELLFRVMLQTWLLQWMSPAWAIGTCAVVFSAVHGYPDAFPLFPLALILGVVYYYRRSYLTIVAIHMLFNFYNLVATLIPPVEGTP